MNKEITEETILEAVEKYRNLFNEEPPFLSRVLEQGKVFRDQGLTPLYIATENTGGIYVTSVEGFENRLN